MKIEVNCSCDEFGEGQICEHVWRRLLDMAMRYREGAIVRELFENLMAGTLRRRNRLNP